MLATSEEAMVEGLKLGKMSWVLADFAGSDLKSLAQLD